LQKKIEQQFTTYVMNFKELEDNLINKRLGEMESRLMARLEQLSSRIESDFDQKLGKAKRESGDGQSSLSNEISDLASAIANQRNEFDMVSCRFNALIVVSYRSLCQIFSFN
uniref:IF rod domain-containing protein n=1 Tax=Anisakis simplex TaxID=6269 RepID=A0A0M3JEP6_ANISI